MPHALRPARRFPILLGLIASVAVCAVSQTYGAINHTSDEPAHVAAGMQWLADGNYWYEPQHPPLARVATAVGPYLDGLRPHRLDNMWEEGLALLYDHGTYQRNVTLARLGILPFLFVLVLGTGCWARALYGETAGLLAAVFVVASPTVLAHAGLATTDLPVTCLVLLALWSTSAWLTAPPETQRRVTFLMGFTTALAFVTKFSAIPFLAVADLGMLATVLWLAPRATVADGGAVGGVGPRSTRLWDLLRPRLRQAGGAALVASLVIWAVYRFQVGYLASYFPFKIPAFLFFGGILEVAQHNHLGHDAYLLGRVRPDGWWYYFPVALGVKTTLGLLAASGLGSLLVVRQALRRRDARLVAPAVAVLAILAFCMCSHINIGVRHVLPIYPLLAMLAGAGMSALWAARPSTSARRWAYGAVVVACVGSSTVETWRASPHYLPYFNALAGQEPADVLLDSNLDWGQDLYALRDTIAARHLGAFPVAYFGLARFGQMGLPTVRYLHVGEYPAGLVGASEMYLHGVGDTSFVWLARYPTVIRVGHSIRIIQVPGDAPEVQRARAAHGDSLVGAESPRWAAP